MRYIIVLFVVVTYGANGQIEKGNWLVGGNLSYSSVKSTFNQGGSSFTNKSTTYTIQPRVGYFPINNLVAGLAIELANSKSETGTNPTIETNSRAFTISPFVRYYLFGKIFLQADYGRGNSVASISPSNSPEKEYTVSRWSAGFGYAAFLNKNTAVEMLLGSRSSTLNEVGGSNRNTTDEVFVGVGMQVYLSKRKE